MRTEECERRRALEGVKVRNCVKQRCRRRMVVRERKGVML